MSNQYGKIPLVAGKPARIDVGGTGLSGIVIGNESGFTCTVSLEGANVKKTLYPGTIDKFLVPKGVTWSGNVVIVPSSDLNNIISWPSSHVYIDTYGVNESIEGQYPVVLNRTGNVGNAVSFVSGSSTSVQNDNNAAGTQVVEMTVLGSPSSNEVHLNDGSGWIGRWINPTFTKTFQWFSAGATALQLGAAGLLTEILGTFKVDQTLTVVGTTSLDNGLITTDGAGKETAIELDAATGVITTLNSTTVNATTGNITTTNGTLVAPNNTFIQIKDNGSVARNILKVDASNNVQIWGIAGQELVQFLSSAGVLQGEFDTNLGLLNLTGTAQSVNGDTSGTMTCYEMFAGILKIAVLIQNNYKQAGAAQRITLKTAFTIQAFVVNAGAGPSSYATAGVDGTGREITWGTGAAAGSQNASSIIQQDSAFFTTGAGFTQVGSKGGYAAAFSGIVIYIGV